MPAKNFALIVRTSLAFIGLALAVGLSIGTSRPMPTNAIVFLNDKEHTYLAPPCINQADGLRVSTAGRAHELKYNPDAKCRDEGYFVQEDRSLTGHLLVMLGVLKPLPNRWNADGSWNW